MKEKINVKAVIILLIFASLGTYIILFEKRIASGIIVITGGVAFTFWETVSLIKKLYSLISPPVKEDNSQTQDRGYQSPQIRAGNNSSFSIQYGNSQTKKRKENKE